MPTKNNIAPREKKTRNRKSLSEQVQELKDQLRSLNQAKNDAYWERNQLVLALTKIFPSYLGRHEESDKSWEDDWRWIVYVEIPVVMLEGKYVQGGFEVKSTKQLSWHIHDSDKEFFSHLPVIEDYKWDGHKTGEKYDRLRAIHINSLVKKFGNYPLTTGKYLV